MIARALAAAALATLGACTWFDDGAPDRACRQDRDCFRAQGEVCDLDTLTCVPGPDAAVAPAPEAAP